MRKPTPTLLLLLLLSTCARAQNETTPLPPTYQTQRLTTTPPTIDGQLQDPAWQSLPWGHLNHQWEPDDAAPPSQQTKFKIGYDDRFLYVAWRALDTEPDRVEPRMSRRDGFPGDWVEINFDSFNDKRTGFSFNLAASGVRGDEFISEDGNEWDDSWNPTWLGRSHVDSLGYTAEARIPLSQIRFGRGDRQTWGLQVSRKLFRKQELTVWAPVKQAEEGWVSRFGTLSGLDGIKARKPLELQPYVLGQLRTGGTFAPDDPFDRTSDTRGSTGLDGRVGITNDVVVDFTVNPDFGQVEADPGAINLDGFQIFFREQRPFFVEGRNIFDYRLGEDLLFYSRRIGGAPTRFLPEDPANGRFVRQPENTTILGAAKVSGKTQSGLSIGLLSSVTERERATIIDLDGERKTVVEPLTAYNVGRFQQDFNAGNSSLGVVLTAVNRDLEEGGFLADRLHRRANSAGVDLVHRWADRAWALRVNAVASDVRGSTVAIRNTQTAFAHLFQRPDADHLRVDTSRTSLRGSGLSVSLSESAGKWTLYTDVNLRSPGLELNDIGFMNTTEEIASVLRVGRLWRTPVGVFNNVSWFNGLSARWDWSGRSLNRRFFSSANATFRNFSRAGLFLNLEQEDFSKNALRGGPILRRPAGYFLRASYSSDERKRLVFGAGAGAGGGYDGNVRGQGLDLSVSYLVTDALRLSLEPALDLNARNDQYVTTRTDGDRTAYVHGRIERQTLSLTARVNYNITPDFTVQYYAQPFAARGIYSDFRDVADPLAKDFSDRYRRYTDIRFDPATGTYAVNDDQDEAVDYTFGNPDFNFLQFRSNLVVRWEYRPGSTVFLVWSQGADGGVDVNRSVFASLTDGLFDQQVRNTFLVKATYRFVR